MQQKLAGCEELAGQDEQQLDVFSCVSPEQRVPQDQPLLQRQSARSVNTLNGFAESWLWHQMPTPIPKESDLAAAARAVACIQLTKPYTAICSHPLATAARAKSVPYKTSLSVISQRFAANGSLV